MNKINLDLCGSWIAIVIIIIAAIWFIWGCAVPQPKQPVPIIAPTPAVQIWQAAKSSNWIVTISILGIAGGVFAALNGQKWGMAVIISCSVALFMSLAVARFAWWMAICGLVGSVGLCMASILARKRALVDIIKGGQKFKKNFGAEGEKYFTTHEFNRIQDSIQSKSTKKIVKKIKEKL